MENKKWEKQDKVKKKVRRQKVAWGKEEKRQ